MSKPHNRTKLEGFTCAKITTNGLKKIKITGLSGSGGSRLFVIVDENDNNLLVAEKGKRYIEHEIDILPSYSYLYFTSQTNTDYEIKLLQKA